MWLIGFDCEMEKYSSNIDQLKREILDSISEMNEEQLNKTIKFIKEYIVK